MKPFECDLAGKRIIGLFPELLGYGGVQEASRLTAAVLGEIALRYDLSTQFIALNDPVGFHSFRVKETQVRFKGFGRDKIKFTIFASRQSREEAFLIVATHPHLAVPCECVKLLCPGVRSIVISHGLEVWKQLPFIRRTALQRSDLILSPSSDTAQKLFDIQGVAGQKIRKMAWPLSPDFLQMADHSDQLPSPKGFPEGRIILTVAREAKVDQYKGTDALLFAVSKLCGEFSDLNLVVVGAGDDLPRLRKIADDLGISNRVKFLGSLSREEVAASYSRCEIFALPSTGEGFGLVFLEAMAFAKPLIGVACGGVVDVVEDGVNGILLPPDNLSSLVEGLAMLLKDPVRSKKLGQRGAVLVRDRYSFEHFQAQLEDLLIEFVLK